MKEPAGSWVVASTLQAPEFPNIIEDQPEGCAQLALLGKWSAKECDARMMGKQNQEFIPEGANDKSKFHLELINADLHKKINTDVLAGPSYSMIVYYYYSRIMSIYFLKKNVLPSWKV